MIRSMIGDDDIELETADLAGYAENFLRNAGMSDEQITALKDRLRR